MDDLLIINCYFGNNIENIHKAPSKKNCYFFTNNSKFKDKIEEKHWTYYFINFPIKELDTSSIQSKYIKFLIFLRDFPEFKKYKHIFYFDHKSDVPERCLPIIYNLIKENLDKSIVIRNHEQNRNTIQTEIDVASRWQSRYRIPMPQTQEYVNELIEKKEIDNNVLLCNTGLIMYVNYNNVTEMLDNIYNKIIEHKQPECQIYWGIFSQKYKSYIKEINWYDFNKLVNYEMRWPH